MKWDKWLLGGIAITAVAAVVAWSCRSEYGSGYSEDQRRNWNEMIEKTTDDLESHLKVLVHSSSSPLVAGMEDRQAGEDAPFWKLDFPAEPVKLPLEGISLVELTHLADQGDGNACLELVFRYFEESAKVGSFGSLSVVFQGEKYLKKATEAGRPGADFLFRLLEERKKRGNNVPCEHVEGYRNFLSHLDMGDFLLGKIYLYLAPKGDAGLNHLTEGLEKKAEGGNLGALRDRGYLDVLRKAQGGVDNSWTCDFFNQNVREGVSLWGERIFEGWELLPDSVRPEHKTILKIQAQMYQVLSSWYLKRARRSLKKSLGLIMKSAERGDLHAKFLWTQYSVWGGMTFSQKEWETYLKYTDELTKSGGRYAGKNLLHVYSRNILLIESFYYKKQSQKEVSMLVGNRKKQECEALFPNAKKSPKNSRAVSSSLSMEVDAKCDMESFVNSYMGDVLGQPVEKTKDTMRGLQLMKQAAEEGNPFALYGLARLLNEGIIVDQDGRKAWELLQRLKIWREGIHEEYLSGGIVVYVEKTENMTSTESDSLGRALGYQLLDVVARHGDMPEMTVKQAFDQFIILKGNDMNSKMKEELKSQFEKRGYKVPDEKNK